MKGRDGRNYKIQATSDVNYINSEEVKDFFFQLVDEESGKVTDEGWLVISKNGTLRIDRIK